VLQAVKDYLKITWDDEDASLQAMIERGKAYLNDLVGKELDYSCLLPADEWYETELAAILTQLMEEPEEPGEGEEPAAPMTIAEAIDLILAAERQRDKQVVMPTPAASLLLDYCRYSYNNASEYFEENFARELLRLQLQVGVSELGVEETTG
jgi:hypothetical protein